MLLILLSVGLIYGAIRGYAYFEQHFAEPVALKQANPPAPTHPAPSQTPEANSPVNHVTTEPPPEATPPPRATIVDE